MKRFFRRAAALAVCGAMICSLGVTAFAGSLDRFRSVNTYDGRFTDIGGWYSAYVVRGYELGLFSGTGEHTFSPDSSVTVGEAVKLAACLHSIYETGSADFEQSDPWWQVYAGYCLDQKIITEDYGDYRNAISRGQFAMLLRACLPAAALTEMNAVADESIPDVRLSDPYGSAVYTLYRAGVLTGSDGRGTFYPGTNLRRSEMAAIAARMVDVTARKSVTLGQSSGAVLTAEQIYARCSKSVFSLATFDQKGDALATGSGVFLAADGEAVTNWHVLDGAASAKVTTTDGKTYDVSGVYDYDAANDLARIQVQGSGFSPVSVNYSGALLTGATTYAIGNPLGLDNSISAGIVSSARRVVNGVNYIQITTPISNGSSGGALLNDRGELVGITSASVSNGQNLNLAIPISALTALEHRTCRSVSAAVEEYIRTLAEGFRLSKSRVTLSPGGETTVVCSAPGIPNGYALSYEVSTRSIVRCAWGKWQSDDTVALTLTGQNLGNVTVTVHLNDRQGNSIASRTIDVKIR